MLTPEDKDVHRGEYQATEKNMHLTQSSDVENIASYHVRKAQHPHISEFYIMSSQNDKQPL